MLMLGISVGTAWLALGVFFSLLAAPVKAASDGPDIRYVAPGGTDVSNDCSRSATPCATIQHAADEAELHSEIRVAQGVYDDIHVSSGNTLVLYVDKHLTIRGGYTTTNWAAPYPLIHPTIIDAQRQGIGILVNENRSVTLEGLRITRGAAFRGAGILIRQGASVIVRACWIYDNIAERYSGGIHVYSGTLMVSDSRVYSNTAGWDGGGINVSHSSAALMRNYIYSNTATTYNAGGVYLNYASNVLLEGNRIYNNTANYHGSGVYSWSSDNVILRDNHIYENEVVSGSGSGIYCVNSQKVRLESNHIDNNTAVTGGGGIEIQQTDDVTMTNNLVVENQLTQPTGEGTGILIGDSTIHSLHDTIASNTSGMGWGIAVQTGSSVWMTNTIVVSHTVGISVSSHSAATLDTTLWANGTDWAGSGNITTANDVQGNPAFLAPAEGDYHISPASAAIDRGIPSSVTVDMDGDPRPTGAAPDTGADEYVPPVYYQYLPAVMKDYP